MSTEYVLIEKSQPLKGTVDLIGAKNAALVIMASLLLNNGKNKLTNVPFSEDVLHMIRLLASLGAIVVPDEVHNTLEVDTTHVNSYKVLPEIMKKMRASILVTGPLLARLKAADVALPGGCNLGSRPIDLHVRALAKMGATITIAGEYLVARAQQLKALTHVLDYPSVGATENIIMAAALTKGTTKIINAAIEPEVIDLIDILQKMGAQIAVQAPATIEIQGVDALRPVEHHIMYDRLEAGSLLLAAAVTGGELEMPQAPAWAMDVFLAKLEEMGHTVTRGPQGRGISFKATHNPHAVSFRTMPYPGFPTDLQAPMMTALCLASGTSVVHETVFENRLVHARELQKMGASITVTGQTATVIGVDELYGAAIIAPDIRASCALVLAGLVAEGQTKMTGVHHLKRGYQGMIEKLNSLGANARIVSEQEKG